MRILSSLNSYFVAWYVKGITNNMPTKGECYEGNIGLNRVLSVIISTARSKCFQYQTMEK